MSNDWDDDMFPTHNVVRRDSFDEDAYERAAQAIPELAKLEDAMTAKTKHGRELVEDVHSILFRPEPKLRDAGELTEGLVQHRELLDSVMQTAEYNKLHAGTQFNATKSALGTVELIKAFQDKLPADKDERRRILRARIKRADQTVDEQLEAYLCFGGRDPGDGATVDLVNVVQASQALARSKKAQEIMRYAGRLRSIAMTKHHARVRHGPDEIVDVEIGNDLSRVLPSELGALSHPVLKLDFLRRFAEGELLQYRIEGTEKLGRGPIVVCVDSSYSMREDDREFWAKGIALGLLSIAVEEKRAFSLINFSSKGQLKRWDFDKPPPVDLLIKALEFSFDGRTCFETPLNEALKVIEASKFNKADVIFITDGECGISDEFERDFVARKKAKYARLFSVLVGFSSRSLAPISDGIERLDDMANDDAVTSLVFGGI